MIESNVPLSGHLEPISLDTLKSGVSFRVLRFSRRHLRGEPLGMAEDDRYASGNERLGHTGKRDLPKLRPFFYSIKRKPLHEKCFREGGVTGGSKS